MKRSRIYSSRGVRHAPNAGRLKRADEVEGLKLGRYPFAAAIPHYLDRRRGTVADSTYIEDERKLKYLAKIFEELKAEGEVETTDPRHMKRGDIQAFMAWMRRNQIDPVTQAKYMHHLSSFLKCFKNFILEKMKADGVRLPKRLPRSLSE